MPSSSLIALKQSQRTKKKKKRKEREAKRPFAFGVAIFLFFFCFFLSFGQQIPKKSKKNVVPVFFFALLLSDCKNNQKMVERHVIRVRQGNLQKK